MIQMSSILPLLKKQGYYIIINTTPKGYKIVKEDPHIDEFLLQDTDQVPNEELGEYWDYLSKKYDKFINLSESVEATWLAMPGRMPYYWPSEVKDKYLNVNYMEFLHDLAGVPHEYGGGFYPAEDEIKWAEDLKNRWGKTIMWVLSGSSVHKTWPYMDHAIARILLEYPEYKIVLVGDELSKMLEAGWEKEKRVIKTCGKWDIRQALTFAQYCQIVIGPETGILNSVAFEPNIGKIIFLSHSSYINLTKHWYRTIALTPDGCDCYPCHQMHYGFSTCKRDAETGVADCQAKISLEKFWKAFRIMMGDEKWQYQDLPILA